MAVKPRKPKVEPGLYNVTVKGDLAVKDGQHDKIVAYVETVPMDKEMVEQGAVSMFVKNYAPHIFPDKVPGYVRVLSHILVDCVDQDEPERPLGQVTLMNRAKLIEHIEYNEYEIEPSLFLDDQALQQAVLDYEESPEDFLRNQENRKQTSGPKIVLQTKAKALLDGAANVPSLAKLNKEVKAAKTARKSKAVSMEDME